MDGLKILNMNCTFNNTYIMYYNEQKIHLYEKYDQYTTLCVKNNLLFEYLIFRSISYFEDVITGRNEYVVIFVKYFKYVS